MVHDVAHDGLLAFFVCWLGPSVPFAAFLLRCGQSYISRRQGDAITRHAFNCVTDVYDNSVVVDLRYLKGSVRQVAELMAAVLKILASNEYGVAG